jgi:hypothetical protein
MNYMNENKKTALQVLGAIVVIAFSSVMYSSSSSGIRDLVNVDTEMLKDVMSGDLPYLYYCHRGGQDEMVPPVFSDLNARKGTKLGFALVNCSQTLPSGKTMYERFHLKKEWRPVIFGTAPWSKPKQASPASMKDVKALTTFVDSALAPRATEVHSEKELLSYCGFQTEKKGKKKQANVELSPISSTCIVLVKGNRHGKAHTDIEERLIANHPKTKFAIVDGSKHQLSIEGPSKPLAADGYSLNVYAFRNATHHLNMVNPVTWDYVNTFVSTAIATPSYQYDGDFKAPVTFAKDAKKKKKSAFKDRSPFGSAGTGSSSSSGGGSGRKSKASKESSSRNKNDARQGAGARAEKPSEAGAGADADTTAKKDAGPQLTPAEIMARKLAAERARREEMERQAKENTVEADMEPDSDGDDNDDDNDDGEDEDEDEEIIEL